MARAPNEKVKKAKELFDKGYKLIDIAKELGTAESTIRVWKNRYKWSNETFQEKKCNVSKKSSNKKSKKKAIVDEVKEVVENNELTDKQKLFCVIYSQCLNATKAYMKVYTCTYETAMVNGSNLLRNTKIKDKVNLLIAEKCNKEFLQRSVIQKYIDIAFSDIGDYVKFGKESKLVWGKDNNGNDVPVMDPETGEQKVYEYNYLDLKESNKVDTTLIGEVSQGKEGIKFKLLDKMKALEFLTKHCNLLSDEEKIKLDIENKKLQNKKLEAEINRIDDKEEETEDDGFIEALEGKVDEIWQE